MKSKRDFRDSKYHKADKVIREHLPTSIKDVQKPSIRFEWVYMKKPWYWIFTFWKTDWVNYGNFIEVKPGTKEYEDAPYEMIYVEHR